ncbi:MAG: hydrogenase expression/formation C-terminal domain-containing protein [Sulfuricella sp.]|nr:hydrogenase expression/formation C-terminal domain-containing protein [Sulfuricella sp.]
MNRISHIPVISVGPGSQPVEEDGAQLEYLVMPEGMRQFSPPPLPEPAQVGHLTAAKAQLGDMRRALERYRAGDANVVFSLNSLDAENLELLNQLLGEGEVSIKLAGEGQTLVQESVLTGVWRVRYLDQAGDCFLDSVEIGCVPQAVLTAASQLSPELAASPDSASAGLMNAPPVLAEIRHYARQPMQGAAARVVNLSLLPMSPQDLAHLDQVLGRGDIVILSRGYGNCRISASGTRNVWWVQYYNSQDALILNTIEVVEVPEAARAAQEDFEDSAARLGEILEWLGVD